MATQPLDTNDVQVRAAAVVARDGLKPKNR
jgi:hypothetical protein